MVLLTVLAILILGPFAAVITYRQITGARVGHELELFAAKKELELEDHRLERVKELLTDGAITGQPVAVEALKPLIAAVADEITYKHAAERLTTENAQELRRLEEQNKPYRLWHDQINNLRQNCSEHGVLDTERFKEALIALSSATREVFQLQLTVPEIKQLPETTE